MCEAELTAIVEIIKGEADNLIAHYRDEGNVCEVAVNRIKLAIEMIGHST